MSSKLFVRQQQEKRFKAEAFGNRPIPIGEQSSHDGNPSIPFQASARPAPMPPDSKNRKPSIMKKPKHFTFRGPRYGAPVRASC
jgi:hypothetical protein